jgi:hypothetical protein
MRPSHTLATALVGAAAIAALCGGVTLAGQSKSGAAGKSWNPPRTADGQPDFSGVWNYSTITPMERPASLGDKQVFTDEEAAEFERQAAKVNDKDRRDNTGATGAVENGTVKTPDLERAYNEFWWDRGTKVVGTKRTSLIVDPPDGRVPALTPAAAKTAVALELIRSRAAWGPEDRPAGERCIHQQRTGPPIMPGGYNNNLRFFQSTGMVAILTEQIHEARMIPLDGRPHVSAVIRQWKGDSRGRWDGNTLVVDTVNFNGQMAYQGSGPNLRLTERFTRTGPESLLYEYTMSDPESFTKPWTVQMTMTKVDDPMFEYACHEGNYGIVGSLQGARAVEKAASTPKKETN